MIPCIDCGERYTPKDVEEGRYFPSTGVCLACYKKRLRSSGTCFGKKDKFNLQSIACGYECPDSRICRSFVYHIKEYKGE